MEHNPSPIPVNINGYWIEDWKFLGKLKYLEGQTQAALASLHQGSCK